MNPVQHLDLTTVLLLAVVLWLDGWRRVPADALVLRRVSIGAWRVAEPWARLGPLALVALWPPLIMPCIVRPDDAAQDASGGARWARDFSIAVARGRRRLRRARVEIAALRIVGTLLLAWIILGIPLATARSGGRGLLLGILGAFCLSTWLSIATAGALRELGARWGGAARACASLVSPFSAMRAPEVVVNEALGGLGPLQRVAALVEREELERWLRPYAYDELHRDSTGAGSPLAGAVRQLPRLVLDAATAAPVIDGDSEDGATYCPRCATVYQRGAESCASCDGVALSTMASSARSPTGAQPQPR